MRRFSLWRALGSRSGAAASSSSSSTAARSPSSSRLERIGWIAGGVAIYGATAALAFSILDDVLIYKKCSSKAMEVAAEDPRMKRILGERFKQGSWYEASLGSAFHKKAVSCTFPVYGDQGSLGSVKLRAIREGNSITSLAYNIIGPAQWDLLVLEATLHSADKKTTDTITLMEPAWSSSRKPAIEAKDDCKACIAASAPAPAPAPAPASTPAGSHEYVNKLMAKN